MAQYGYQDGVNLDPMVVDYLLRKKDKNYRGSSSQQESPNRAQNILQQLEVVRGREASPEYQARLADNQESGIDPAFVSALAKSSAQAGTLNGKVADTSAVEDYANAMERSKQQRLMRSDQTAKTSDRYDEMRLRSAMGQDELDRDMMKARADAANKASDNEFKNKEIGIKQSQLEASRAHDTNMEQFKREELGFKDREFGLKDREVGLKGRELDIKEKEALKPVYASHIEGTDAQGNPVTKVIDKQGNTIQTIAGGKPKSFNQDEKAYAYHAARAMDAENVLQQVEKTGYDPSSYGRAGRDAKVPFTNVRPMANRADRSYRQAQEEFIASILRKESGANVTEGEFERYSSIYFPEPGADETIKQQKATARQRAVENLKTMAGGAYNSDMQHPFAYKPEGNSGEAMAAPIQGKAPPPPGKIRVINPQTGKPGFIPVEDLQEALNQGYREVK